MRRLVFWFVHSVFFASAATAETELSVSANKKVDISSGVEYSSGNYGGTSTTDIIYIPLTSRYTTGRAGFSLTVPYISVTSTDHSVVPGVGRMGPMMPNLGGGSSGKGSGMGGKMAGGSSSSTQSTQAGLGDIIALAAYDFFIGDKLGMTALGGVKFGTADPNKGLGTGQNDYSAEVDGIYVMNNYSLLGTVGYKIVGKPIDYTLNDIAYGSLGFSHALEDNTRFRLILNGAQSSNQYSSNLLALAAAYSQQMSNRLGWSASLAKGLSDGSPAWDGWLSAYSNF